MSWTESVPGRRCRILPERRARAESSPCSLTAGRTSSVDAYNRPLWRICSALTLAWQKQRKTQLRPYFLQWGILMAHVAAIWIFSSRLARSTRIHRVEASRAVEADYRIGVQAQSIGKTVVQLDLMPSTFWRILLHRNSTNPAMTSFSFDIWTDSAALWSDWTMSATFFVRLCRLLVVCVCVWMCCFSLEEFTFWSIHLRSHRMILLDSVQFSATIESTPQTDLSEEQTELHFSVSFFYPLFLISLNKLKVEIPDLQKCMVAGEWFKQDCVGVAGCQFLHRKIYTKRTGLYVVRYLQTINIASWMYLPGNWNLPNEMPHTLFYGSQILFAKTSKIPLESIKFNETCAGVCHLKGCSHLPPVFWRATLFLEQWSLQSNYHCRWKK